MVLLRKRVWIPAAAVVLAAAAATVWAYHGWQSLLAPMQIAEEGAWLDVPRGKPLGALSRELGERGLLDKPWALTWYARLSGAATQIRAGEYRLERGTTPLALLAKLVSGQVHLHQFTIVEGWRFSDLLNELRANPAIVASERTGGEIMAELGSPDLHPEGQFLPETYSFPRGTPELEILREAHVALVGRLDMAWQTRSVSTPRLQTAYDALILASIIEKETARPDERGVISAVFHRRLERGMRLQTDPTVIYGMGDGFDGDLRDRDLVNDTPYNTYTRGGLPPTPIALAGGAAIDAAVHPAESDALYFVATGLPDGSHHFSATLEEHERAVRAYLRELGSRAK
jgi:UPF0755 protein